MRRAAALALCLIGCQFPPAALPDLGSDGSQPPGRDGASDPPDAAMPDAEIPDAMPDAFSCPPGFTQVGLGCYLIQTDDLTWQDAEQQCEGRGAHLAIIDGAQENVALTTLASDAGLWYPWIGLTDHAVEGLFRWVDDSLPFYTNWNSGEPNNSGGWGAPENCGELRPEGNWNDSDCDAAGDSICEWDGRPIGTIFW